MHTLLLALAAFVGACLLALAGIIALASADTRRRPLHAPHTPMLDGYATPEEAGVQLPPT